MIVLVPSFFIIAFAHQQSVLYAGLILFSFGKFSSFITVVFCLTPASCKWRQSVCPFVCCH